MGIILTIMICIVLYYIIVFSFCKNDDIRVVLSFCGIILLVPVAVATSQIDNKYKFNTFKVKYQYLLSTDISQLDYNGKIIYYQDIQYINDEIIFSQKYHDSFWLGIFTNEYYKNYKLLD